MSEEDLVKSMPEFGNGPDDDANASAFEEATE